MTITTLQNSTNDVFQGKPISRPLQRPESLFELDVRKEILEGLLLKILYLSGPLSTVELSKHIGLSIAVIDELFSRLRAEQLCEITGMSRNIPTIASTSRGRARALEFLAVSQYAGAAPISMESYVAQVRQQSTRNVEVHPPDVERAFAHLVVDDKTLAKLGSSLNSGSSIFLYGPTGVGKTTFAETLSRVLAEDKVWIPFSVEVDGQIITVYDPLVHKSVEESTPKNSDRRWVLCHRPAVLVGGELTVQMLDLQFNPFTKLYTGPVQMKANNGVLIIDDFGRQRLRPEALLNRWVVPLDRRIDFLTLAGGKTIEIPFEMLVVFATNLDPAKLVDPAFLRRIQTKIKVGEVTAEQFCEIFRRVVSDRGLECEDGILSDVAAMIHDEMGQALRPCYPRDIVDQICWAAKYEGKKPHLDRAAVMRAAEAYFLPND